MGGEIPPKQRQNMKKETQAHSGALGESKSIPLSEVGRSESIEPVTNEDFAKKAEVAKFMDEILTIVIPESGNPEDLPVVTPSVNGINQPIIRGATSKVKRKYVEALARGRQTKYTQVTPNLNERDKIEMVPKHVLLYPFTVVHDPNPAGREWLQAILKSE